MSTENEIGSSELLSETLIQEQLQRIFLCPAFSVSDILRRFLTHIVHETLAGRSNTIKEYTIAVNVLNKPVSFKPQHDAIVRIHAGRLRRALNYYYKEQGIDDPIDISVPKGSYVPVFGRTHLPEPHPEPEIKMLPDNSLHDTVTIAIMPFKTFETDISRQAFADSLGQQLSAELGRFPDFSVVAYYTTQQLTSKYKEIQQLASDFGAHYVITGNVLFEERRLRVGVQLTDTHTGTQIWSELYHQPYKDSNYFEVTDRIVSQMIAVLGDFNGIIIQQLARGLTKTKTGRPLSTMLSWYHNFYFSCTGEEFRKSYSAMEYVTEQQPSNEIAWAFYGELSLAAFLFNDKIRENLLIQGIKGTRTALKINPLSQQGYITLAMTNIFLNNKPAAMEALEHAIALNPNASGSLGIIGCLMILLGEYDKGISRIEKSMEYNKYYPQFLSLFVSLYHIKHKNYILAFQEAEKMNRPDLAMNILLRISSLSKLGRKEELDDLAKTLKGYTQEKLWLSREYIQRFLFDKELVEQLDKSLKFAKITRISRLTVA